MLNRPESGGWQRTSPFAVVFFLGATIKTIARNFLQLVASIGALAYLFRDSGYNALAISAGVLAIGAVAVLRYWFFRFKLEEDRILIRQGFLKKTALDLPFDRVQGINVERSVIDRLLGLVTVSLDTAGSVGAECRLPAVGTELADWLRTRVDSRRRAVGRGAAAEDARRSGLPDQQARADGPSQPTSPDHAASRGHAASPGTVLLKLTGADMFRIGLANRNVLVAVGALAAFGEVLDRAEEAIVGVFDATTTAVAGFGAFAGAIAVAGLVLALLVLGLVAVIAGAFLRHHDFTLWREGSTYHTRGGLLTQKEVVVESAKIQHLTLSQSVVLRWFGRYRLRAHPVMALPTQPGDATRALNLADALEVPLLGGRLAERLRSQVFGGEPDGLTMLPDGTAFIRVSRYYRRALALRVGIPPMLVGTAFLFVGLGPTVAWGGAAGIGCIAWAMVTGLISVQLWRRRGYMHDDDGLASRSGLIGRKVDAFLFRKAQGVTVTQSPLQRRKALATLHVHLASGNVSVPYIEHDVACLLRDYILYRAESSPERWH